MLGLCKFLSSSSGRLIGRFIPFQPCAILLHLLGAFSESVDWTVFSIILTIHHCEFSSLNTYRFIQRFNSRLAWVFFDIDLKGSHSTYVLLGLCKISALNSYRFLGRFFPWPAWVTLLNQGAPAQPSDCLNCSGSYYTKSEIVNFGHLKSFINMSSSLITHWLLRLCSELYCQQCEIVNSCLNIAAAFLIDEISSSMLMALPHPLNDWLLFLSNGKFLNIKK